MADKTDDLADLLMGDAIGGDIDPMATSGIGVVELPEHKLGRIAALCNSLVSLDDDIAEKEAELKTLKDNRRALAEKTIPDAMTEMQLRTLGLQDGRGIEIVDIIAASISEAMRAQAHAWLRENGHGDIIRTTFEADLGKGNTEAVQKLISTAVSLGAVYKTKEAVHHQTLQKLARELVSGGSSELPTEVLGIWTAKQAKVIPAAKK